MKLILKSPSGVSYIYRGCGVDLSSINNQLNIQQERREKYSKSKDPEGGIELIMGARGINKLEAKDKKESQSYYTHK
jgi:hypothetical protein